MKNIVNLGHLSKVDRKIMLTLYSKIDDKYLKETEKLNYHNRHINQAEYSISLNGTIYIKKGNKREVFKNFKSDLSIQCPEEENECSEASVFVFNPEIEGIYYLEYRPIYISSMYKLNGNLFISLGAMKFNPNYITLNLINRIINLFFLITLFIFYTNGMNKVSKDLWCTEQKYIKTMTILLFFVNEPFTSFNIGLSERYGVANLIFSSAFYSFVLYFWLVIFEVVYFFN